MMNQDADNKLRRGLTTVRSTALGIAGATLLSFPALAAPPATTVRAKRRLRSQRAALLRPDQTNHTPPGDHDDPA